MFISTKCIMQQYKHVFCEKEGQHPSFSQQVYYHDSKMVCGFSVVQSPFVAFQFHKCIAVDALSLRRITKPNTYLHLSLCPWSFHTSDNFSTEGKAAAPITAMRTEYIQSFCIGRTDLKRNSIKASQMVCGPAALKILDKHKHTATSTGIRKLQPKADQKHKLPYSPQARKHRFSKDSFLQITRTILKFL